MTCPERHPESLVPCVRTDKHERHKGEIVNAHGTYRSTWVVWWTTTVRSYGPAEGVAATEGEVRGSGLPGDRSEGDG